MTYHDNRQFVFWWKSINCAPQATKKFCAKNTIVHTVQGCKIYNKKLVPDSLITWYDVSWCGGGDHKLGFQYDVICGWPLSKMMIFLADTSWHLHNYTGTNYGGERESEIGRKFLRICFWDKSPFQKDTINQGWRGAFCTSFFQF